MKLKLYRAILIYAGFTWAQVKAMSHEHRCQAWIMAVVNYDFLSEFGRLDLRD